MRAISLWQPHATLAVMGAKQWETRTWPTKVTGEVLIQAAKTHEWDWMQLQAPFSKYLQGRPLRYGFILGQVTIERCVPTEDVRAKLSEDELMFGDYKTGRYAWHLVKPIMWKTPLLYNGSQGFFDVPDQIIHQHRMMNRY